MKKQVLADNIRKRNEYALLRYAIGGVGACLFYTTAAIAQSPYHNKSHIPEALPAVEINLEAVELLHNTENYYPAATAMAVANSGVQTPIAASSVNSNIETVEGEGNVVLREKAIAGQKDRKIGKYVPLPQLRQVALVSSTQPLKKDVKEQEKHNEAEAGYTALPPGELPIVITDEGKQLANSTVTRDNNQGNKKVAVGTAAPQPVTIKDTEEEQEIEIASSGVPASLGSGGTAERTVEEGDAADTAVAEDDSRVANSDVAREAEGTEEDTSFEQEIAQVADGEDMEDVILLEDNENAQEPSTHEGQQPAVPENQETISGRTEAKDTKASVKGSEKKGDGLFSILKRWGEKAHLSRGKPSRKEKEKVLIENENNQDRQEGVSKDAAGKEEVYVPSVKEIEKATTQEIQKEGISPKEGEQGKDPWDIFIKSQPEKQDEGGYEKEGTAVTPEGMDDEHINVIEDVQHPGQSGKTEEAEKATVPPEGLEVGQQPSFVPVPTLRPWKTAAKKLPQPVLKPMVEEDRKLLADDDLPARDAEEDSLMEAGEDQVAKIHEEDASDTAPLPQQPTKDISDGPVAISDTGANTGNGNTEVYEDKDEDSVYEEGEADEAGGASGPIAAPVVPLQPEAETPSHQGEAEVEEGGGAEQRTDIPSAPAMPLEHDNPVSAVQPGETEAVDSTVTSLKQPSSEVAGQQSIAPVDAEDTDGAENMPLNEITIAPVGKGTAMPSQAGPQVQEEEAITASLSPSSHTQQVAAPIPSMEGTPLPAPDASGKLISIAFTPHSSELTSSDTTQLSALVANIKDDASKRVKIVSYAGMEEGQANASRRVSLQRAIAIRALMIAKGLESARINVQAMGENAPRGIPDRADVYLLSE